MCTLEREKKSMEITNLVLTVGVLLGNALDFTDGKRCYSTRRGNSYYCDSTEECCSDNSYPCCDAGLTTGAIIGLAIGIIIFIVIIALVVYLCYRASKRKRSVTTTTVVGQPTIRTYQTTTYTQNTHGMATYPQGQVYPPNYPQGDPAYPPPPPTYTA